MKADGFMVMAHGTAEEMTHAKSILETCNPSHLDTFGRDGQPVRGSPRRYGRLKRAVGSITRVARGAAQ